MTQINDSESRELERLRERARHNEAAALRRERAKADAHWQGVVANKDAHWQGVAADKDAEIARLRAKLDGGLQ
jgi:hypothetical protein